MGSKTFNSFNTDDNYNKSLLKHNYIDSSIFPAPLKYYDTYAVDGDEKTYVYYKFDERSILLGFTGNNGKVYNCQSPGTEDTNQDISTDAILYRAANCESGVYLCISFGNNIYKSLNYGATWASATNPNPGVRCRFIHYSEIFDKIYLSYEDGKLYYSSDCGESYTYMNNYDSGNYVTDVVCDGLSEYFSYHTGHLFCSTDGLSLSSFGSALPTSISVRVLKYVTTNTWVAVISTSSTVSKIYVSANNMSYWNDVTPAALKTAYSATCHNGTVYVGGTNASNQLRICKGTNNAGTWTYTDLTSEPTDSGIMSFVTYGNILVFATLTGGKIYTSADEGVTWNLSSNTFDTRTDAMLADVISGGYAPQDSGKQGYNLKYNYNKNYDTGVWSGNSINLIDEVSGAYSNEVGEYLAPGSGCVEIELILTKTGAEHYIMQNSDGSTNTEIKISSDIFTFSNTNSGTESVSSEALSNADHSIRIKYDKLNSLITLYVDKISVDTAAINSSALDMSSNFVTFINQAGYDPCKISLFRVSEGERYDDEINADFTETDDYTDFAYYIVRSTEALDLSGQKIDSITGTILENGGNIRFALYDVDNDSYWWCNPTSTPTAYSVEEITVLSNLSTKNNTLIQASTYFDRIVQAGHTNILPIFIFTGTGTERPKLTDFTINYSTSNEAPSVNAGQNKTTLTGTEFACFSDAEISDTGGEATLDYATYSIEGNSGNISKSGYDTLQAAVRAFTYTFSNEDIISPFIECTLTAFDTEGLSTQDTCSVSVIDGGGSVSNRPTASIDAPITGTTFTTENVTIRWSGTDPEDASLTYWLYLDTVEDPNTIILSNTELLEYSVGNLVSNTTYYYSVKSYNGTAFSDLASGNFSTGNIIENNITQKEYSALNLYPDSGYYAGLV